MATKTALLKNLETGNLIIIFLVINLPVSNVKWNEAIINGGKKMETTTLPLPWWLALIMLAIAALALYLFGLYRENKGWDEAKKAYHGKLLQKSDLVIGAHYEVLGITPSGSGSEQPKFAFAVLKGKINKEADISEWFGVDLAFADVSDKEKNLFIKAGNKIVKTMEEDIVVL